MRLKNKVVAFDIETIETPEAHWSSCDRHEEIRTRYGEKIAALPDKFAKQESIDKHTKIFTEKMEKELATPDKAWKFSPAGARIISCAWRLGEYNGADIEWGEVEGIQDHADVGERKIVKTFTDYISNNVSAKEFSLVAFNLFGFDLPVLLRAMEQHDITLLRRADTFGLVDLMRVQPFSSKSYGQDYWAHHFGYKGDYSTDGSMVAELFAADETNETQKVLEYNMEDVKKVTHLIDVVHRIVC